MPARRRVPVPAHVPVPARVRAWLDHWGGLLPVLVVELVVLVGFGALLPILPLYLVSNGIDSALLGLIIAAWPIAKLVSEPLFGYLADRRSRRPLMLVALVILGGSMLMPVWLTSAPAFFLARAVGGLATGIYDPAARGIIVDSTPDERRGEAFGLYGAFQMGGLILGPVVGSAAATAFGGFAFPFVLTAILVLLSAIYLWVALRDLPAARPGASAARRPSPLGDAVGPTTHLGPGGEELATSLLGDAALAAHAGTAADRTASFANRLLLAAIVMQLAFSFSTGVYEVTWSLYMQRLGASIEWIGLTFTLFAVPVMLLSPVAGRLVDRYGGLRFAIAGGLIVAASGVVYTMAAEPVMPAAVGLVEATGFAFTSPALFWLLARGTPPGRTSTAQGIFGAAGTIGTIVSALAAGLLWALDPRYPFYFFVAVSLIGIGVTLTIVRRPSGSLTPRLRPDGADPTAPIPRP